MAINTHGFDDEDITEAGFSKLMRALGEVGYKHGVLSGLTVSAGGGTRQVSVAAGIGYAPGLWFENTAPVTLTLAANATSSNRVDYIVMKVDWAANSAVLHVVQGSSASAPALTQTEGAVWHVPLARVTVKPGATSFVAGDIVACKPLPRVVRKFVGSAIAAVTRSYSSSAYTISSVSVGDPGWPYRLEIHGAAKFAPTGSGYVSLNAVVDGTVLETGRTGRLDNGGSQPVSVQAASDVMTGPATAKLTIEPYLMAAGSEVQLQPGPNCRFYVLQIPA